MIKTVKTTQSYNFATCSLTALTQIHSMWYSYNSDLNTYVKIVPLNIAEILSASS